MRTHHCASLGAQDVDRQVTLTGWVARMRDHGGVNFVDLRDRWGMTQVVFRPAPNIELHTQSKALRPEFCIQVNGHVAPRPEGTINTSIPTGQIEVIADKLVIFSESKTPPFEIESDTKISEEVRLKHRYLDLRRKDMQAALLFRSDFLQQLRIFLHKEEFAEIETPILTRSTPEGARDYLVPSRVNPGQFFALPQSPQLFKQLLMVSGLDRYFQIAKCFRDEDLRADRQPEFTQLDMEMSFIEEERIYDVIERLFQFVFKASLDKHLTVPFKRLSYQDAMRLYGSDKPDLRFDMPIQDVSQVFAKTTLKIFKATLAKKGKILLLHVHKPSVTFSRKDFDEMIAFAKEYGAGGLAYMRVTEDGFESPIAKFMQPEELKALRALLKPSAHPGDLIFFGADEARKAQVYMGAVRLRLAEKQKILPMSGFSLVWIQDFPLFKWNADSKSWDSEHHPFTGVHPEDQDKVGKDNGQIRSRSYDLVLNGNEIASGSIRIHDEKLQQKVLREIGIDGKTARERFGFLLNAFQYGPPPHGGIAVGIDRLLAIIMGKESIRELIAFPKTQRALCPLTQAPSPVDTKQLTELGIKTL